MKTKQSAVSATYRVPTRDEMKLLVDTITGLVLDGVRVRHWNASIGKTITGLSLLDQSDEFMIHHRDGSAEVRHAECLCRDSFEVLGRWVSGRPAGRSYNVEPAWLERGEG